MRLFPFELCCQIILSVLFICIIYAVVLFKSIRAYNTIKGFGIR